MSAARAPRSQPYDGFVYGRLVEPLLAGLHARVAREIAPGTEHLEACCGTGALAMRLAGRCARVRGVDLSPKQIAYAEARRRRQAVANLQFEVGDVSNLSGVADETFDSASVVLALHEMPAAARALVLRELGRVGREVVVVDFEVPMPRNLPGLRNRILEFAAGREHFGAFRDYRRRGGLAPVVEAAGLHLVRERTLDGGTLRLMVLARPR